MGVRAVQCSLQAEDVQQQHVVPMCLPVISSPPYDKRLNESLKQLCIPALSVVKEF